MKRFIVCGPNGLKGNYTLEVHAAGCADLARPKYKFVDQEPVNAENAGEAAMDMFGGEESGYTVDDAKIFPCCNQAPEVKEGGAA
jgi:hypothetical protein